MHAESNDVRQVYRDNKQLVVRSKNPGTGETYVALFNTSEEQRTVEATLLDLGITKKSVNAVNLWTGENAGKCKGIVSATLAPHACVLYSLK